MENNILGIHAATSVGIYALTANVEETVSNIIYEKLNAKPIPKESPMPPLRFWHDKETPITVSINAAKGEANLL